MAMGVTLRKVRVAREQRVKENEVIIPRAGRSMVVLRADSD
jgi:hypothetical protein